MSLRCVLMVCLILVPVQVAGQGTISGVAADASGLVLPGVTVELGSAGASRSRVTDANGRYEFRNVQVGTYSLTFTLRGFSTLRREGISLRPETPSQTVNVVLLLVGLGESFQQPRPRAPRPDQNSPSCLHGANETTAERSRREDALAAMRMIDYVITRPMPRPPAPPSWETLAKSPVVATLRGMAGPVGDLARRIAWGEPEPLPGWRIVFIPYNGVPPDVRFALTDLRDPCAFTYSSQDPNVLPRGYRILPLQEGS